MQLKHSKTKDSILILDKQNNFFLQDAYAETWGLHRLPNESLLQFIQRAYSFKTNKTNCLGLEENIPAYLAMNNAVVKTFNHTYYFASSAGMQKKIREK